MATFGSAAESAGNQTASSDRKYVSSATPASSGTVTKVSFRAAVSSTATVAKGVIYADAAGAPGALLATGAEVAVSSTTPVWHDSTMTLAVVSGTPYWVGVHIQDPGATSNIVYFAATPSGSQRSNDTYSDGPTDPFGTPTAQDGPINAYATYTEGAPAARDVKRMALLGVA